MITNISINNFLSFDEKQDVSISDNIFSIIGHNSSGKSNIIKVIQVLKNFILLSHRTQPDMILFPLNKSKFSTSNITKLGIQFKINDNIYDYNIEYSFYIRKEELKKNSKLVFDCKRTIDNEENVFNKILNLTGETPNTFNIDFNVNTDFNTNNNEYLDKYLEFSRHNSSFISTVKSLNGNYFDEFYNYFNNIYIQDGAIQGTPMIFTDKNFINLITKENNKDDILKLINFVDKDITDFIPITRKVIGKSFKINIDGNSLNNSVIEEASDSSEIDEIIFKKDGVDFTSMETSNGLLKLMQIIPNLFNVIKNDGILIVDELDTGLNPKIYENLLSLFKDKKGQLIFTTHNLLFLENLKTSQICIVEKENHHSIVNLLSKFYKDTNYANYIRDYLQDKLTLNYLEKKDLPKTEFNDSILDDI